jgi:hypothetical protein
MTTSKKTKLFTLIIFNFLLLQNVFSQENFTKGFIISVKGDTIKGFIDYRNWEKNPDKITFKNLNSETKKTINPIDIQGFGVNNDFYESAIVKLELSSNSTIDLTILKELDMKTDTVFLEAMFRGSKSLYSYKSEQIREQFFIKNQGVFELLIYKRYLKNTDEQTKIAENATYLSQLSMYFQEASNIQSRLRSVEYTKKSLKSLFANYYSQSQDSSKFQKKTEKAFLEFGVLAGVSIFNINFKGTAFPELINGNFNTSIKPTVGINLDIVFPRNQKRWSLRNEIMYSSFTTEGNYLDYEYEEKYSTYKTNLDYAYLKLVNMIRYKLLIGKVDIFINGGISNGLAIKNEKTLEKKTRLFSFNRVENLDPIKSNANYEQGFLLGLGIKYNKYSFEIRNERGTGMSTAISLVSPTNRLSFLIGYQF